MKMKILVICQYYAPEPFRITDICETLVAQGHEVMVIAGTPNYPEGYVYEGYKHGRKKDEVINGVCVHRCYTVGRRKGVLFRILNYYSFVISSVRYAKRLREKFDIVFVNQLSPVMMARAGIAYKKKHKVPLLMYCLDLWPESLVAGGVKKDSLVYKIFLKISRDIYKRADRVLVSSKKFSLYFEDKFGITETGYLPQYAEMLFDEKTCQKVPNETIDLMFAGNVGFAQSINTIIYAAQKTADIQNLRWHIVGDGSELTEAKMLSQSLMLSNVIFHGRQPLHAMPSYYAMADAMLVTMQKDDIISMTLPGKVQTYMAAGKAIIGAIDGETAEVISEAKCGLCCSAQDAQGLAQCARDFVSNKETAHFATNALAYSKKHFSNELFFKKLEDELSRTVCAKNV